MVHVSVVLAGHKPSQNNYLSCIFHLIFSGMIKNKEKCNKDYKMFTCHAALTTCQGGRTSVVFSCPGYGDGV